MLHAASQILRSAADPIKRSAILLALLLSTFSPFARADENPPDQVAAATGNAIDSLRTQIGQIQLARNVTIQTIIDRTHSQEAFSQTFARAQQIGGPRWLNSQTVQVQLEIPGRRITQALTQIVEANPKKSPITPEFLATRLGDLEKRTFSATGTSTGSAAIEDVRPQNQGQAWASVQDDARRQAVAAAKRDAANRILDSFRPVPLSSGKTVADVLAVPSVRDAVDAWLSSRPVTRLEFRPDLQVRLTLAAPADELFDIFHSAAANQKQVPLTADDAAWDSIRQAFVTRLTSTTGHASALAALPPAEKAAVELPATPPDWVDRQIDAQGSARPQNPRALKCARAAEADAVAKLRTQIESLPFTPNLTLGEAAKRDRHVADALARTLALAKPYKVDYQSDGSTRVRVVLELRQLWDEIRSTP